MLEIVISSFPHATAIFTSSDFFFFFFLKEFGF